MNSKNVRLDAVLTFGKSSDEWILQNLKDMAS